MGRLYDRLDLSWNLNFWNQQEQMLHAEIANGLVQASVLNRTITYPGGKDVSSKPSRHIRLGEAFEFERKRERFKLLRTGWLLRNLDEWQKIFKSCPHCHQEVHSRGRFKGQTRDVPCQAHAEGYRKAKSDVWWAGEHNVEERNVRGQHRAEGVTTTREALEGLPERTGGENPLNKWEELYSRDKAEGQWTQDDAKRYDVDFSYKGWLHARLEDEEITETEYLTECQRLREQERELEQLSAPTDRQLPMHLPKTAKRGQLAFKRDNRFTHLTN
jgi:hypothetical protein